MNMIDAIYQIQYNPFKYGEYIYRFYSNLPKYQNNILLLPLIIPLCSHSYYANKINGSNTRSSLLTIFENKKELYDLQERIDTLRLLSTQSLQYCLSKEWLELKIDELNVYGNPLDKKLVKQFNQDSKVAEKLALLFGRYSVDEIYSYLGVNL
ncbi:TPA: three component ABC system middle component [Mannheimia haemolytica]